MRVHGIAGRHGSHEDPLVSMDYGHLKLDGTEDVDDDVEDEVA